MKKDKVCGEGGGEGGREGGREGERERRRERLIPWFVLQEYSLAPNIMAMPGVSSRFNQLALLIPSEFLEEETPHARAKVIPKFIKMSGRVHKIINGIIILYYYYGGYGFVIHNIDLSCSAIRLLASVIRFATTIL